MPADCCSTEHSIEAENSPSDQGQQKDYRAARLTKRWASVS